MLCCIKYKENETEVLLSLLMSRMQKTFLKKLFPLNTDLRGQYLIRKPQATSSCPFAEALTISDAETFFLIGRHQPPPPLPHP